LAPTPIHPNFFNYVLILPDDVVRAGSLLKWT
jgi:hypothetical protein